MKLCDTCTYGDKTEYFKPCIVYSDDCKLYEEKEVTMDDCISRQAVHYYIESHIHEIITESGVDKNDHTNRILRALVNGVDTMPSVTPTDSVIEDIKAEIAKSLSIECDDFSYDNGFNNATKRALRIIDKHIKVTPTERIGHCKDCKYFEYDSVAKVDGIPLIVAHEICKKWGDGCKTKENGYCFLFEPQESEE